MILIIHVRMSSSESSGLSEEHDPMAIVSDEEIAPAPEIFTSDSETDPELMSDETILMISSQPFTLPEFGDDIPFVDDVLAFPLPIHDQLIIGHPNSEHLVEFIQIHVVPLAAIPVENWPFVVDLDDDIDVPVIEVDHLDDDLGDGESVTSSALLVAGLGAYPTDDDDDDVMSVAPATPVHVPTPTDTPPQTPTHAASDSSSQPPVSADHSSGARSIRYASAFLHTPPTHGGEPSGYPHISPPDFSPHFQSLRLFPPYTMPLSDPYHPSHHTGYTRDDLLLSLQLQVEILYRRVYELENEADARRPPPSDYPPVVTPPPPSSPHQHLHHHLFVHLLRVMLLDFSP
ncbi:hypothetical protein Hanom_Chr14g01252671 [Helianthus anomalus]